MCINYRKLQQIKMELIGKEDVPPKINFNGVNEHGDGISKMGSDDQNVTKALSVASSGNNNKGKPVCTDEAHQNCDLQPLYVKTNYSDVDRKPSDIQFNKGFKQNRDSRDVTLLFGTPSPTNISDVSSRSSYQLRSNHDMEVMQDPLITEDSFPSGINSAHTYCLHYPKDEGTCLSLTLAELTCHDDMGNKIAGNANEGLHGEKDTEVKASDTGDGDFTIKSRLELLDTNNGSSELAKSLNALKAETMCARIQHQIAMAALPCINRAQESSSKGCIQTVKQSSQREKQDLQSCREALLNLRLRLLPPTKQNSAGIKEKRIQSDASLASPFKESMLRNIQDPEKGTAPDIPKIKENLFPVPKRCQSIQGCKSKK
jgi:hypothetical protein